MCAIAAPVPADCLAPALPLPVKAATWGARLFPIACLLVSAPLCLLACLPTRNHTSFLLCPPMVMMFAYDPYD